MHKQIVIGYATIPTPVQAGSGSKDLLMHLSPYSSLSRNTPWYSLQV